MRLEQEEKAKVSLAKAQEVVKRQVAIMGSAGWKEKVKAEVRELEEKKLRDAETEAARLEEHIKELENLRI